MSRNDIRYDKSKVWIKVVILAVSITGSTYLVYLTDTFADNIVLTYLMLPLNLFLLYHAIQLALTILDKQPALSVTSEGLEYYDNSKIRRIKW